MQDNIPDALIAAFQRHYDFPWNEPSLRNERLAWRAAWASALEQANAEVQAAWIAGQDEVRSQRPVQAAVDAPVAAPDVPGAGANALREYLKTCEQHSNAPDVGGAFACAFAAGFNFSALSAQAAPVAVGEREAFEAWYLEETKRRVIAMRKWSDDEIRSAHLNKQECGRYASTPVHMAWLSWQARAALAATPATVQVVLPEPDTSGMRLVNAGALQMVINALRRDADEGKAVRGEMADELLAGVSAPAAPIATVTRFHDLGGEIEWTGRAIAPVGASLYLAPQQADARDAAPAASEQDAQDAKRYRWMRSSPNPACDISLAKHFGGGRCQDFDALIDAAIAAQAANGGDKQ